MIVPFIFLPVVYGSTLFSTVSSTLDFVNILMLAYLVGEK